MSESNLNEFKSKLEELKRIEKFLRAEVKSLWIEIDRIKALPFFALYERVASKCKNLTNRIQFKASKKMDTHNEKSFHYEDKSFNPKRHLDFLFLVPTNNQEIGGINTTFNLVEEMIRFGIKEIAICSINLDPTVEKKGHLLTLEQAKNLKSIKNIVITGIDCIPLYLELKSKFNHNLIINLLGPDFMFFNNWESSKKFLQLLKCSDLILCLTPYLEKLLKLLNIESPTFVTLLGPDKSIFNLKNKKVRDKTIAISCRSQNEKGLKFLIPYLSVIRNKGWKIIGFGDLPEHSMANEFDEFIGRVYLKDLSNIFNRSRYLIDPSLIEGMGLTTLEAASCGCLPIILKRHSLDDIFTESAKPCLEISNLASPQELFQLLGQDLSITPEEISRKQYLSFSDGVTRTINKLIEYR